MHENSSALSHFIRIAEKTRGGLDDIWLLGDLFGHADESTGEDDLIPSVLDSFQILEKYKGLMVQGNWEYWLTHPERDEENKDQGKYRSQLAQRRELLKNKGKYSSLLEQMVQNTVRIYPEKGKGEFSLFHGCTYACHRNSDYQPHPCECYLFPRDLNIVTRGLFGNGDNLRTPHFFFGHTHTPGFFTYSVTSMVNMWQFFTPEMKDRPVSYGNGGQRFGINPGTAGIETKRFPRTAVLLDTAERTFTYLVDTEE